MRNNGKRGGGAVDPGDLQSQVMSPQLPPASHGSAVPVNSVPVPAVIMSGLPQAGPVFPSQHQNFIHPSSPVSVVSSRLSDSSLSVLQQFQRHTLRAPVLRNFAVSDFRVWHLKFVQFMTRAGAEFATAIQYPAPSGPPTSPAILAAVEQLLLDALQPALTSTVNPNAVSILNSFLLLSVLALHFRQLLFMKITMRLLNWLRAFRLLQLVVMWLFVIPVFARLSLIS
jgi:hypothetical protein